MRAWHLPACAEHRIAQELGAGDATSRGVRHAFIAMTGEMGYPSALSAKTWGFYDVLFKGKRSRFLSLRFLRDGERALQDLFPPNFMHRQQLSARCGCTSRCAASECDRAHRHRNRARVRIIDKTVRSRTPPIAITASSTWLRYRSSSGG